MGSSQIDVGGGFVFASTFKKWSVRLSRSGRCQIELKVRSLIRVVSGGRNRTDFAAISTKNSKFHQPIKRTLSLLGPAWTYAFGVRFGVRLEELL